MPTKITLNTDLDELISPGYKIQKLNTFSLIEDVDQVKKYIKDREDKGYNVDIYGKNKYALSLFKINDTEYENLFFSIKPNIIIACSPESN